MTNVCRSLKVIDDRHKDGGIFVIQGVSSRKMYKVFLDFLKYSLKAYFSKNEKNNFIK